MADNYTVLDSAAATLTKASKDIGGTVHADKVHSVDASGTSAVVPGTAATHLGKAEDAAHTTGDTGVAMLAVRRDAAASGAGSDGDYATVNVDSTGRVYVVLSGTAANDILKAEDAAHSTADAGVMMLAVRRDTAAVGSGTDGDYSTLNVDSAGWLRVRAATDAPAAAAHTSVASSASSVQLLAATARKGFTIFNDSTQVLYIKYGATASATSYLAQIAASGFYEDPWGWNGVVDGIWASANGNARIVELT